MPRRNDTDRGPAYRPDVIKTFHADTECRLIDFLIASMPEQSRTAVKQKLAHNQVMVNGAVTTQFDTPVHPGAVVKVNFTREFRSFYNRRLKILYEDDDIIVVNKGYGLLSMGTDKIKDGTAYELLRDWVKWQNPAQATVRVSGYLWWMPIEKYVSSDFRVEELRYRIACRGASQEHPG